ncbi:Na+/H+ antiporter subunit G, partial [Kocuria subflava]
MQTVLDVVGSVLLLVGCLMAFAAGVGLVRLPDVLTRMHAAT